MIELISVRLSGQCTKLLNVTPDPKIALPVAGIVTVPPALLLNAVVVPTPCVNTALFNVMRYCC